MENTFTVTDIRLHSLTFTQQSVKDEITDKDAVTVRSDYRFQSFHDESNVEYTVILGARLHGKGIPYVVAVEICGAFRFEQPPTEEDEHLFTSSASPQILFPYVREVVSDMLRRAGYPAIYLQPVNFQNAEVVREK